MLKQQRAIQTHEDIFLASYDRLMAWATQLTEHNLQQAEDLVHDVFVKFALTRPDLQRIENLDGYLYTSLRNTYRSQIRRASCGPTQQLSLLDYDSAELGMRFIESRHSLEAQQELHLICHYACSRKETSKTAGVLILRYFLGYFPSEIAMILQAERQTVAELLRVARAETRLFSHDPQRLKLASRDSMPSPGRADIHHTTEELLLALRRQIFSARSGECSSRKELARRYQNTKNLQVERAALAHLVSCPRCLDEVNKLLGLPPLADRNPTDFTGSDPGSGGGMGETGLKKSAGGKGHSRNRGTEALKRFRRQIQLVYEHEPKELRIAVNGQPLGSQEIGAVLNKQTLNLNGIERITFVEIYSEQEVRMAYMVVEEPPKGEFDQQEIVDLSDQRRLEVNLSFKGPQPELQVIYYNPSLRAEAATHVASLDSPFLRVIPAAPAMAIEENGDIPRGESESAPWRWLMRLRWLTAAPRIAVMDDGHDSHKIRQNSNNRETAIKRSVSWRQSPPHLITVQYVRIGN